MRIDFHWRWPIYLSLLVAMGVATIPWATPDTVSLLLGERGPLERSTALFYLAAALLAGVAVVQAQGVIRLYSAFWMLLSLACFGEETSWLQHEIGFATPQAIEAMNVQREFNLHNLKVLQGGKMLGEQAVAPTLRSLLNAQTLFQLGFVLFFLALPVLARTSTIAALLNRARIPYPGARMVTVIWAPILVAICLALLTQGLIKDVAAEARELFYAAAFLLFTGTLAASLRTQRRQVEASRLS